MQTLRSSFAPPQTPFPGAREGQNLISWRWSLPLPTKPVWWGSMDAILSYRGNRPTHTNTPTHTQTRPITIHCTAASAQCNYISQIGLLCLFANGYTTRLKMFWMMQSMLPVCIHLTWSMINHLAEWNVCSCGLPYRGCGISGIQSSFTFI